MSFSVLIDSVNGNGANRYSLSYYFNWENTPQYQGKYKLYMNFIAKGNSLTGDSVAMISTNIGCTQRSFTAKQTNGSSNNNILGYVKPWQTGTTQNLYADYFVNPPVIIEGKPTNNNFTINILNLDSTAYTALTQDYILNLYFELCNE